MTQSGHSRRGHQTKSPELCRGFGFESAKIIGTLDRSQRGHVERIIENYSDYWERVCRHIYSKYLLFGFRRSRQRRKYKLRHFGADQDRDYANSDVGDWLLFRHSQRQLASRQTGEVAVSFLEKLAGVLIFVAVIFVLNILAQKIFPTKTDANPEQRFAYRLLVYALLAGVIGVIYVLAASTRKMPPLAAVADPTV
jgi:hypothetical protein